MAKLEYAFLTFTSFPSSVKLINEEARRRGWWVIFKDLPVIPESKVIVEIKGKAENVQIGSYLTIYGSADGVTYRYLDFIVPRSTLLGTSPWATYTEEYKTTIPTDVNFLRGQLVAGQGVTWFDDLKIYQDGVPIYENKFSNWGQFINIPAPILAGLGVVRLGKKG